VTDQDRTTLHEIPSGQVVKTWLAGSLARLTADGRMFVRVEKEFGAISLGDPATGKVAGILPIKTADNGADNGLAFSPDGKLLAAVYDRDRLQLWDTATRKQLGEVKIPPLAIRKNDPHYALTFSPDGRSVVLQTKRGEIERWEVPSLATLPKLETAGARYINGGTTYICGTHWSRDGQTILALAGNGLVHRWDARTGKRFPDDGYTSRVSFALTSDGSGLVVAERTWKINVHDTATGRVVHQVDGTQDRGPELTCVAVSPDGRQLAAAEGMGAVRLFRTDGRGEVRRIEWMPGLTGPNIHFLAWAPDGKSLFTGESGICRWNLADSKMIWALGDLNLPAFALSADGRRVAKTLPEGIQFLNATTGKELSMSRLARTAEETGDYRPLRALAFAPDGKRLALAIGQYRIGICDSAGRELRRFIAADRWLPDDRELRRFIAADRNPYHRVKALAWTPDGTWLVSGAEDQAVKVWEVATGKLVTRFAGHDSSVEQVAVAPDGRSAFSSGGDGFVYQWDLTPRSAAPSGQQPRDLWTAAAGDDPALAVPAAWALVTRSEESRALVGAKLPPLKAPSRGVLERWLADLDSPAFSDREAATQALAAQGRLVERDLREMVRETRSAEVRRRVERLLARIENGYTPDELRALRLVQACEFAGTSTACALLKQWAGGAPDGVLTEEAKAALSRIDGRKSGSK
jgi:WD40 repeat protein